MGVVPGPVAVRKVLRTRSPPPRPALAPLWRTAHTDTPRPPVRSRSSDLEYTCTSSVPVSALVRTNIISTAPMSPVLVRMSTGVGSIDAPMGLAALQRISPTRRHT